MRMLARLPGLAYVLDHNGTVYQLPNNGNPGIPVPYPAAEAHALHRHGDFFRRLDRDPEAD